MANQNSDNRLFFEVSAWKQNYEYAHIEINVMRGSSVENLSNSDLLFKLSWQTDTKTWNQVENGGEEHAWYAGQVEIRATRLERITEAAQAVRKFFGNEIEDLYFCQPAAAVKRLLSMATEVVYDKRLGRYILMISLAPADWSAYTEDYKALGQQGPQIRVMASNDQVATYAVRLKLMDCGWDEYTAKWIMADKPIRKVEQSEYSRMEDFRTGTEKAIQNPF